MVALMVQVMDTYGINIINSQTLIHAAGYILCTASPGVRPASRSK